MPNRGVLNGLGAGDTVWNDPRLGARTDGRVPVADSTQPLGVKWGAGGGGSETESIVSASGSAQTADVSTATVWDITLTANCTISFTGATAGRAFCLTVILRQDATGSRTVTWPGSVTWPSGSAPAMPTAANAIEAFTFVTTDGGTTWLGGAIVRLGGTSDVAVVANANAGGSTGKYADAGHAHAGVRSIVAGTNVAVSNDGSGNITVNSSGGGGSLTSGESSLTADVTAVNANTYYDILSVSLAAGTYLVTASTSIQISGNTGWFTVRLWDGTNVFCEAEGYIATVGQAETRAPTAIITLSSTTTVKTSFAVSVGSSAGLAKATVSTNGTANKATKLDYVKIA